MQPRFGKRRGQRALRLINERRFRAAYDFLLLRVDEEPELAELAQWWTEVQTVEADDRIGMIQSVSEGSGKRRRRPRRRKPSGTT
jgi:poly(A) polymerase